MLGTPSRRLWIAAIIVAVVCISGLAYGLITDWNTPADKTLASREVHRSGGSGFGVGLMLGVGAGIAIGSVIALRSKR